MILFTMTKSPPKQQLTVTYSPSLTKMLSEMFSSDLSRVVDNDFDDQQRNNPFSNPHTDGIGNVRSTCCDEPSIIHLRLCSIGLQKEEHPVELMKNLLSLSIRITPIINKFHMKILKSWIHVDLAAEVPFPQDVSTETRFASS